MPGSWWRAAVLTATALLCFAANSLLCRAALRPGAIDPASFTLVRLATGAAVLAVLARWRAHPTTAPARRALAAPAALCAYALAFSFAYVRLPAGTGALVLFGAVQVTMLGAALRGGERPRPRAWLGIALALGGLVALTLPGLGAPDPLGAALMATAGVAWGAYTLAGRGAADPIGATARNFAGSVPLALAGWAAALAVAGHAHAAPRGLALAAASGGLASGLGYAAWYTALPALTATRAAVVQLAVPALTAGLAVLLLGETVSARLALAAAAVLGGIALVLRAR